MIIKVSREIRVNQEMLQQKVIKVMKAIKGKKEKQVLIILQKVKKVSQELVIKENLDQQ